MYLFTKVRPKNIISKLKYLFKSHCLQKTSSCISSTEHLRKTASTHPPPAWISSPRTPRTCWPCTARSSCGTPPRTPLPWDQTPPAVCCSSVLAFGPQPAASYRLSPPPLPLCWRWEALQLRQGLLLLGLVPDHWNWRIPRSSGCLLLCLRNHNRLVVSYYKIHASSESA